MCPCFESQGRLQSLQECFLSPTEHGVRSGSASLDKRNQKLRNQHQKQAKEREKWPQRCERNRLGGWMLFSSQGANGKVAMGLDKKRPQYGLATLSAAISTGCHMLQERLDVSAARWEEPGKILAVPCQHFPPTKNVVSERHHFSKPDQVRGQTTDRGTANQYETTSSCDYYILKHELICYQSGIVMRNAGMGMGIIRAHANLAKSYGHLQNW